MGFSGDDFRNRRSGNTKGKNLRAEEADMSDDSFASSSTMERDDEEGGGGEEAELSSQLAEQIEELSEKRAAARKAALTALNKILTTNVCDDELENWTQTLVSSLLGMMKKGDSTEVSLAARCFGLLVITLGPDAHAIYEDVVPPLMAALQSRKTGSAASAVLECLALFCFTAGEDRREASRLMDICSSRFLAKSADCEDVQAALACWGLLVTLLPESEVASNLESMLEPLARFLEHQSMDVRIAAGECIALLFNAHYSYSEHIEDPTEIPELPDTTELLATVHDLVTFCAKSTAKADRLRQRLVFRGVEQVLQSGTVDIQSIKMRGESVELSSWSSIRQMEALRRVLQDGLLLHLEGNPFMRSSFALGQPLDFSGPKVRRSALQKRLHCSPNSAESHVSTQSKLKSQLRAKQRVHRSQRCGTHAE